MLSDALQHFFLQGIRQNMNAAADAFSYSEISRAGVHEVFVAVSGGWMSDYSISAVRTPGNTRQQIRPMKGPANGDDLCFRIA